MMQGGLAAIPSWDGWKITTFYLTQMRFILRDECLLISDIFHVYVPPLVPEV